MTTDARRLAARLAARDDARLAEVLAARGVPTNAHWRDFFDAAEGLLDAASLATALASLPRGRAAALARASAAHVPVEGGSLPALDALALVDEDGTPYARVAAAIRDAAIPDSGDGTPTAASDADAARAAERAFTNVGVLAETVMASLHAPVSRIGTGSVGAADRRRLVEQGIVAEPADVDAIVGLAESAGLLRVSGKSWLVTEAGAAWLREPTTRRWADAARGLRDDLPDGLRTTAGGWIDPAAWPSAYPLDPAWPARAEQLRSRAALIGLIADDGGEPPWAESLRRGDDPDVAPLAALLPREVDRVYLQNDLTAIAPGPLAPTLDVRLRAMAVRESHAQASTYRFTADSLAGALTEGETGESMRSFLTELSLTGLPQPLAYLIERSAERHGLVRVAADAASGRTRITSDADDVLDLLVVDQSLRPLGLVRDDDGVSSRATRDVVYWALADARYPVLAVDEGDNGQALHRYRLAPDEPAPLTPAERYAVLIASLREGHGGDADTAWLGRELDAAVRTKSVVAVVVALPDGSSREFTLEATGLGGGRLRGRDKGADVERTLPVSSIVSVRTVG